MSKYRLSQPYLTWPALAALFLVALSLRLYCLDCRTLWSDEIASIEVAQRGLQALLTDRFGWMRVQTPMHYLVVWLTIQPVDPIATATLVRLPSAIAGALTPLAVYGLGRELFGRPQGLLAASMLALAPVHINYSQDVRPYALLTLLTAASVYSLLVAHRTGLAKWWLLFTFLSVANVLNAYVSLTLVLPALAPYLLWLLWNLRPGRPNGRRPFSYALFSLGALAMVALLMLVDMLQVPRVPPDLRQLPPAALILSPLELLSWFSQLGIGGQWERVAQLFLLLLMLSGVLFAVRTRKLQGAALCLLFVLVPSIVLAILSTTNAVFQRYALFAMPFYFLLVGNGLALLPSILPAKQANPARSPRTLSMLPATLSTALVMLAFAVGVRNYMSNDRHQELTYRPDFRSAHAYLLTNARPEDTIVLMGWDALVSTFYWRGNPPATAYSALDPDLFRHDPQGAVYWLASYDFDLPQTILADKRWTEVKQFDRVVLLKQAGSAGTKSDLDWFVRQLEGVSPRTRSVEQTAMNLRASIYQSNGQISEAASAYRVAGSYFPMGDEYLRTAQGFALRSETASAWRDTLLSKSMEPQNADLHAWMSQMLSDMGRQDESRIEAQIAYALGGRP
ncbi:MAG TPA: glycosyltransferase family 39 protein [Chloroflexia bacterium]